MMGETGKVKSVNIYWSSACELTQALGTNTMSIVYAVSSIVRRN